MQASNRLTVLVVEDEPATRYLLTMLLESNDYRVIMASDGQSGIDVALEARPDALLLDLMLPGVDGFEVIRVLGEAAPSLPIIALSAGGERPNAAHRNVRAFLPKPSPTEEILQTLERVLIPAAGGDRAGALGYP